MVVELHGWPVVRSPLQEHRGKASDPVDPVSERLCKTSSQPDSGGMGTHGGEITGGGAHFLYKILQRKPSATRTPI